MRVSYHHANPMGGNESFLLRFHVGDEPAGRDTCVLVDAGDGVEIDRLLNDTDRLAAICLTHPHLDHYQSIERCRTDETVIYASPPTAAVLDDVFDVAAHEYDVRTSETTLNAIEPIDSWTEIAPGVSAHPVPAGHVPGAVGYLFQIQDGEESHHILATGDFTHRRAAGFPGFDAESLLDIDVLFMTVATSEDFSPSISEGLARALQRAHSGARTLVATSGLLGVHAAYLLTGIAEEFDREVPIRVVGQAAKIYEALDYDCPLVEAILRFRDPQKCLEHGAITIAGPEIPHERSSGRLFGVLKEDPGSCVVQLIGTGGSPIREGNCTIHAYEVANHPRRGTLDEIHEAIDPKQTVVVHRHRGAGSEFNDWSSIVRAPGDTQEYTLYDEGEWNRPEWIPDNVLREDATTQNVGQVAGDELLGGLSMPALERHDEVDLAAEGVDTELVAEILDQRRAYVTNSGAEPNSPVREEEQHEDAEPQQQATTMAIDESTTDDERERELRPDVSGEVFDTAAREFDEIDPAITAAIEEGDLSRDDVEQLYQLLHQYDSPEQLIQDTEEAKQESDTAEPEDAHDEVPSTDTGNEADEGGPAPSETDETADGSKEDSPDETPADQTGREQTEPAEDPAGNDRTVRTEAGDTSPPSDALDVSLDPITAALVSRSTSEAEGEAAFVHRAVQTFLARIIEGEVDVAASDNGQLSIAGPPVLVEALEATLADDDRFDDISDLVSDGTSGALATDYETSLHVPDLEPYLPLLDSVADNDEYGCATREAMIRTAVRSRIARE